VGDNFTLNSNDIRRDVAVNGEIEKDALGWKSQAEVAQRAVHRAEWSELARDP